MAIVWGTRVIPTPAQPGAHFNNATFDTANGQTIILIGNTPTGYDPNGSNSVVLTAGDYDLFGFLQGQVTVDTFTMPAGVVRYQVIFPSATEIVGFYEKDNGAGGLELQRDLVNVAGDSPTQTIDTIDPTINGVSESIQASYRTSGTGAGTYSIAYDVFNAGAGTDDIKFQIFNPDNSVSSSLVTLQHFTGVANVDAAPAWAFRSGGSVYESVVEQTDHSLQFQNWSVTGTATGNANNTFTITPTGATDVLGVKFFQFSGVSKYFVVYDQHNTDGSNSVVFDVVGSATNNHGQILATHTFNIASGAEQKVRISGDTVTNSVVVAYGNSTGTTLVQYDQNGTQLDTITLAGLAFALGDNVRGNGLQSLDDGRYQVATITDTSAVTTSETLTTVDFRTAGLNINDSATVVTEHQDYAGTQFADTVIGVNDHSDVFMGMGGNDSFVGGNATDISVYQNDRANYFVHTANVSGSLVTTVTQIGGPLADGTDTLKSVEILDFNPTISPNASDPDPGHAFALAGIDENRVSNFDGHAYDDVMLQVNGTGQLVFANMESGVFNGFGVLTSPLPGINPVGHADMTGDGIADVIVQVASTDQVLINIQNGTGTGSSNWVAASSTLKGGTADFHAVGVGDITGDALPDIILQNEGASGDGSILAITGLVSPGVPDLVTVSGSLRVDGVVDFRVVGVGDINGDGFADIVLQNQLNGGQVLIDDFHNHNTFTLANATGPFQVVGVGDINGDGHADVILQQASGGDVIYLDPTGGANDFKLAVGGIPGLFAKGVADVDNDGFAEILLANPVSGEVDYRHVGASDADGHFGAVIFPNGGALVLV